MKKLIACCLVTAALAGTAGFLLGRKQALTREHVVTYLSNLSDKDLAEITHGLEAHWGPSTDPPGVVPVPAPASAPAPK